MEQKTAGRRKDLKAQHGQEHQCNIPDKKRLRLKLEECAMINIFCKACVFFPLEPWSGFYFGAFVFGFFLALLLFVDCWPIRGISRVEETLVEFLVSFNFA